jgi:hypothetical protein
VFAAGDVAMALTDDEGHYIADVLPTRDLHGPLRRT